MRADLAAVAAALVWLVFLVIERIVLSRARSRIAFVIEVNGTRGKSETTRLAAAALRGSGFRVLAKTTGTEARLILPDGSERRLRRGASLRGADVREQRSLLLLASRLGAEVVVAECMAVSPEAQYASLAFLRPSHLAITNCRPDHVGELGEPEEALEVFAGGIPAGGAVFTAEASLATTLAERAEARGAALVLSRPLEGTGAVRAENAGLALELALACGAGREEAIEGMKGHVPDPGAFGLRRLAREGGGELVLVDALAANDVVSTALLLETAPKASSPSRILLIANRADRPERAAAFAAWAAEGSGKSWDRTMVLGPLPLAARRVLAAAFRGCDASGRPRLSRVKARGLRAALLGLEAGAVVHAVGNWKDMGTIVRRMEACGAGEKDGRERGAEGASS